MNESYDYDSSRRLDRTYISRRFTDRNGRPMRIVTIAVAPNEDFHEALEKDSLVIRVTSGGRQYLKATFYEDTRGIQTLTFRRYTTATGAPHEIYFSFNPPEIDRIIEFLLSIKKLHITKPSSLTIPAQATPSKRSSRPIKSSTTFTNIPISQLRFFITRSPQRMWLHLAIVVRN